MSVNKTAYMHSINKLTNSLLRFVHPISQRHQLKMHSEEMRYARTSLEAEFALVNIKPIKVAEIYSRGSAGNGSTVVDHEVVS